MKVKGLQAFPLPVTLVGLLFSLSACAVNPVTGQTELMLVSEEQEAQMGRQTDKEVTQQYGLYDDKALAAYVAAVGRRLGAFSHRPQLPYDFKVVDTAGVNAFAVPGGYVYLTRGILCYINNEAELAGIIGHEIGHIAARHSAEQYSRAQLAQIGLAAGMLLSPALQNLGDVAQLGVQMLFLSFSRENEREADDLGVEYSTRAGYDSNQMAVFFETLERMNPSSDRSGLPEWFSTHPNPEDRIGAVKRKTLEWQRKVGVKRYEVGQDAYLKMVDGLMYGDNPREGYAMEGVFYHPDMRFQFPVPAGWKLQNTRETVRLSSPQKDALLTMTLSSARSPRDAAQNFVRQTGAQVVESGEETIGGFASVRLTSQVQTSKGILGVLSYFIQKEGRVFEFQGLCGAGSFKSYGLTFQNTVRGFRQLSDPDKINVKSDRIRVVKSPSSGTLGPVLRSLGAPQDKVEEWALLNGGTVSDRVQTGAPLKVIKK